MSTPVATVAVDGAGQASIDVSPAATTTYEATYVGDDTWVPAASSVVVNVAKHSTSIKLRARPV